MTEQGYREQAIKELEEKMNMERVYIQSCLNFSGRSMIRYAIEQRERVLRLEDALREVARGSQLSMDVPKWRLSEEVCDLIRAVNDVIKFFE